LPAYALDCQCEFAHPFVSPGYKYNDDNKNKVDLVATTTAATAANDKALLHTCYEDKDKDAYGRCSNWSTMLPCHFFMD